MGAKGRLIIANHTIVEALPWRRASTGYMGEIWRHRRKLKLSDPVSRDVARAHAEMAQEVCCVVREKPRGPRGGHGQMHYNTQPDRWSTWWPTAWDNAPKHCTFFLVTEVVSVAQVEKAQATAGMDFRHAEERIAAHRAAHPEIVREWKTRDDMTSELEPLTSHQLDAYQKALADSVNNGLGVMEVGQIDGMRYIESAKVGDEP